MADELTPAPAEAKDMDLKEQIKAILAEIKAEAEAAELVEDKDPPSDPAPNPTPMGADETAAAMDALRKKFGRGVISYGTAEDTINGEKIERE